MDECREYGLAHTLKLSGIQRTNFVELQQLYERLIVSHGFDAVYSFSLEVREKEREFPNRAFSADCPLGLPLQNGTAHVQYGT